jgi:metallophosphoesterase (TIGR00282 family)
VGDVVGRPGREYLAAVFPRLRREYAPDLVIANAENAAGGMGVTHEIVDELLGMGVDVLTSGNHVWDKKEALELADQEERLLRPLNYPPGVPGRGMLVLEVKGTRVAVLNASGRVFFGTLFDCPFRAVDRALAELAGDCEVAVLDFHAEATSEKVAMGWYLNGRIGAVIGTHTHVQTADEVILPGGTAYITDVGMTGPYESVIGIKREIIMARFLNQLPSRFEVARGKRQLNAVVVDTAGGRATAITRLLWRE